jgi:hypothetical protein
VPVGVGLPRRQPRTRLVELAPESLLLGCEGPVPRVERGAIDAIVEVEFEQSRSFRRHAREALG